MNDIARRIGEQRDEWGYERLRMREHFVTFAKYNAWANARIYKAVSGLTDEQYRRDIGIYFRNLHGTLNHLLVADRIWMRRLTGTGDHPSSLSAILHEDFASLSLARRAETSGSASSSAL